LQGIEFKHSAEVEQEARDREFEGLQRLGDQLDAQEKAEGIGNIE
jgi:hypothetical protein